MNRISTYLTCAALLTASGAFAATSGKEYLKDTLKVNDAFKVNSTVATRAEYVKISPRIINEDGDNVNSVWAVTTIDGEYAVFGMEDWGDGDEFAFYVPEGTYDFFAFGYNDDKSGVIMLTQENVEVTTDFAGIQFDSADAVNSTTITYSMPSGNPVILDGGSGAKNAYRLDNIHVILYEGNFIFFGNNAFFTQPEEISVRSNFTSGKFGYASIDFAATTEGMLNYVVPVTFENNTVNAGSSNWQTASINVAETPVNIKKQEVDSDDPYTYASYMLLQNGDWILTAGWGIFGEGYDSTKVGLWEPENYDGDLSIVAIPRGAVMNGGDSCIDGLPLQRGENGLQQMGVNYAFENYLVFTNTESSYENLNPLYSGVPTEAVFGNCSPSLLTVKYWDKVRFNFLGRYGEAMNIDSWYNYFAVENYLPTHSVKLSLNGDVITTDPEDFADFEWEEEGTYTVEVSTDNVLIDGEIDGSTTGTLTFDTNTYEGVLPSVSVVSFIDYNDNTLTDRISDIENSSMIVYAAGFEFEVSDVHNYEEYQLTTPAEVIVEYAPTGTGNYVELEATEVPENFFSPGYGAYYDVPLSGIEGEYANQWFDVRITVTTEQGASQVQEISPAFYVTTTSGVNTIEKSNIESAPAYYNLQGQRILSPAKGEIVIRTQGSKTEKIIF